jgi:hypothetical protein
MLTTPYKTWYEEATLFIPFFFKEEVEAKPHTSNSNKIFSKLSFNKEKGESS